MDDRNFDEESAREWINSIEDPKAKVRDGDIYPRLNVWMNEVSPREILDIGCGQGICSEKIDLQGRRYTGLEPSPFLLERAWQLYSSGNRQYIQGSAYEMPFAADSFDAAFSIVVWHLLSDLRKSASELGRVLKGKGHFLIVTANPGAADVWKELYMGPRDILYFHTVEELGAALRAVQLEIKKTETFRSSERSGSRDIFLSIQGQKIQNTVHKR